MQEVNEIIIDLSEPQTAVLASRQSVILDMAGQGCFVGSTPVKTADGLKEIKDIKPGEKVLSVNPKTGKSEFKKVTDVFKYMAGQIKQKLITFVFYDNTTIKCTVNHEFYIAGTWVQAGSIARRIMEIRKGNGRTVFNKQRRPPIYKELERWKQPRNNEARFRCKRLFAYNDYSVRQNTNCKDASRCRVGVEGKPAIVTGSKPFRHRKNKQCRVEPGMVNRFGQHETRGKEWVSNLQGKRTRRKKQDGEANRSTGPGNKNKIHSPQSFRVPISKRIRRFKGNRERYFTGENLGAFELNILLVKDFKIESLNVPVYDIAILDSFCFCITESNVLVHNSGKSQNIGYSSGMFISDFPRALGFIGANTQTQLSQSTLDRVFKVWRHVFGFTEYDAKVNPEGSYVIDKRPPRHFDRIHYLRDYHGTISFYNGALIFIGSLENYQAHEGKEFAWAHLDETKDTKEAALKEVIIGRLRQYGMWTEINTGEVYFLPNLKPAEAVEQNLKAWNPLYIHTSPSLGGVKWLNDMFKLGKFEKEIKQEVLKKEKGFFNVEFENKAVVIYSAHHNAENLPPNYIENQISNLITEDAILKLVYGYPFGKSGGEYYPTFNRSKHVRKVPYIPGLPVHMTWDFNGVPYMTCLCSQVQYVTYYLDAVGNKHETPAPGYHAIEVLQIRFYREYCYGKFGEVGTAESNTIEAICATFAQEHNPEITEVFYYGDAQGANRIEGMGSLTRFKIMESKLQPFLHNYSKKNRVPNVGNSVRRDLLNKIFAGRIPDVEMLFDESMEFTIGDFEHVKEGPDGKIKSKVEDKETGARYEAIGHTSDAAEYEVAEVARQYIKQAA